MAFERDGEVTHDLQKRWLYLIPSVFITYSLAYVDRANYGFGAAAGLAAELHISEDQSALLASLFFLGYFLFQIPGAMYARRQSIKIPICIALVAWGVLASLTGVVRMLWLLIVIRFLLGVAESFVMPSMLLLLTRWFTRKERSRANTLLILGNPVTVLWMSAVTGYIIHRFGWRAAFIFEGLPSVVWGFAWLFIVADTPADAKWMSPAAQQHLLEQQRHEQSLLRPANTGFRLAGDLTVWALVGAYLLWNIGVYGFVLWIPSIIHKSAAVGITETGLLSAVPYLAAIVLMLGVSHFSDRHASRKAFVWPLLLLAGVSMYASYATISFSFWIAFAALVAAGALMYAPYGAFFAAISDTYPEGSATVVFAAVNSAGALGSFLGSWIVGLLGAHTHGPRAGFLFMAVCLVLSAMLLVPLRLGAARHEVGLPPGLQVPQS